MLVRRDEKNTRCKGRLGTCTAQLVVQEAERPEVPPSSCATESVDPSRPSTASVKRNQPPLVDALLPVLLSLPLALAASGSVALPACPPPGDTTCHVHSSGSICAKVSPLSTVWPFTSNCSFRAPNVHCAARARAGRAAEEQNSNESIFGTDGADVHAAWRAAPPRRPLQSSGRRLVKLTLTCLEVVCPGIHAKISTCQPRQSNASRSQPEHPPRGHWVRHRLSSLPRCTNGGQCPDLRTALRPSVLVSCAAEASQVLLVQQVVLHPLPAVRRRWFAVHRRGICNAACV